MPLPDGEYVAERFTELLYALGFRAVGVVKKRRWPGALDWQGKNVVVALDDVDGLGTFVELEILCEECDVNASKVAMNSLAAELGLSQSERRSYLELLVD